MTDIKVKNVFAKAGYKRVYGYRGSEIWLMAIRVDLFRDSGRACVCLCPGWERLNRRAAVWSLLSIISVTQREARNLGVIQKCNLLRLSICLTVFFSSLVQSGFSEEAAAIYYSTCCQRRGVIQSSITKKHYIQMESGSMTNLCTLKPKWNNFMWDIMGKCLIRSVSPTNTHGLRIILWCLNSRMEKNVILWLCA